MPYNKMVNVVSKKRLRKFWKQYPDSEQPLTRWYNLFRKTSPSHFADLRQTFASADFVNPQTIFNVGGNKYRVVVIIDYEYQFAKIKNVFTHEEYDLWNQEEKS
jgi:mRNA interferase HigB